MPQVGTVLQSRYRLDSFLSQGGMGNVYQARDVRLKIPVAIKEMVPQSGLDPHTLTQLSQQFEQEALVLARLNHPHLVRVTDFFEESGSVYLVMDYVEGESLADKIHRQGALPEAQVLAWIRQLLNALAYCHSQGIIHRDIKPRNVVIRSDGLAILVDFGLVKLWNPQDPHTKALLRGRGTPEYTPLEQYDGSTEHTDQRSDIYSLGATLYHALTGHPPKIAPTRAVQPGSLIPIRVLNSAVHDQTAEIITRALALQPTARFQSAQEMAAALGKTASLRPKEKVAQVQTGTPYQTRMLPKKASLRLPPRQSFEPEMILIPAGEFLMGTREQDIPRLIKQYGGNEASYKEEVPQHTLDLPDYYIAKTPVTNAQYQAFVADAGQSPPEHWKRKKPPEGKGDHPVVHVSWRDAMAYCHWLTEVTGKSYCLPSEAEWEKAARGTDGRIYPWGNEWDPNRCNTSEKYISYTTPVGKYPPGASPYGCLDMAGNVWEWTRSLYTEYPYDPKDGREDLNEERKDRRVIRGGSWNDSQDSARCAYRLSLDPGGEWSFRGFRVVVSSIS